MARANRLRGDLLNGIRDSAGKVLLGFATPVASAVNSIQVANAATGSGPSLTATGSDTNVPLVLRAKQAGTAVNRLILNPTAKTIVDGSATSLFEVAVAAGAYCSGHVLFTVFASDGTDHQALAGTAVYAAVNKAATSTATITYTTAPEAKAVSTGTLTLAWTIVDSTNKVTVKLQPTGSLTETTYTVIYTILPHAGAVTIL